MLGFVVVVSPRARSKTLQLSLFYKPRCICANAAVIATGSKFAATFADCEASRRFSSFCLSLVMSHLAAESGGVVCAPCCSRSLRIHALLSRSISRLVCHCFFMAAWSSTAAPSTEWADLGIVFFTVFFRSCGSCFHSLPSSSHSASARSVSCSKTISTNQTSICISSPCNEHSTGLISNRNYASHHFTDHGTYHRKQDTEANQNSTMGSVEIAQNAEKFCKLISKNPNSCIESLLDGVPMEVSPAVVVEVLKKLSNAGFLALSFFRWAEKQQGFKHTTESYNWLIESLGKIKQFNVIWNLVSDMKRKGILSRETFALISRRYARARKVKEAIESFEKMEKFGFQVGVSDFNRLIDTLCKSRNVLKAQEVFDKMKHSRFKPDIKSYTILLEGWGQDQNLLRLNEVYREMRDNGFEPDVVTFGIVINAHCKVKKYDEAIRLFHEMKAKNVKPSPHVFCTLINGLGSEKRLSEALEFFEQLKLSGFAPEAPTYNAVVAAYCWSMKMADAYRMVNEMRKFGIGPNSRTYDIILHHLIKGRRSKQAYSVFQRMSSEPGCEPTVSTYEIMVRMFCNEERLDMAIQIWDEMKAKGVLPGMHMFSTLINSLCYENKLEDACKYFQEMLDVGIRPPAAMFSNLKQALLDEGREDTALLLAEKIEKLRKVPLLG